MTRFRVINCQALSYLGCGRANHRILVRVVRQVSPKDLYAYGSFFKNTTPARKGFLHDVAQQIWITLAVRRERRTGENSIELIKNALPLLIGRRNP